MRAIRNLIKNSKGATAIEYGLIAAAYASDPLASSSGFGRRFFGPVPSI